MRRAIPILALTLITSIGCESTSPKIKEPRPAAAAPDQGQPARAEVPPTPTARAAQPQLELVAEFTGPMATGVTVSPDSRIYVCFPRWLDPVQVTAAEFRDGQLLPVPNAAMNRLDTDRAAELLVSVQSVVADANNRLWLVDPGNVNFGQNYVGGPKLVAVDPKTNQVLQLIHFPETVARPNSYLNDVRFDLRRGDKGIAYLTDSSTKGDNGLIVVDLATGQSWRKLDKHPSVLPAPEFTPTIQGEADQPMMTRQPGSPPQSLKIGSDGIALSPDGKTLYYRPLASHHLYSVPTDLLVNRDIPDTQVASAVREYGDLGFASDGLECDAEGRLYLTDYEHRAIRRGDPTAQTAFHPEILVQDPRLIWPDTLSISADDYLYITSNQLNRQPQFHNGNDLRRQPYSTLFRVKIDARAIATK